MDSSGNDPPSKDFQSFANPSQLRVHIMGKERFELPKHKATDLQSVRFIHLAYLPKLIFMTATIHEDLA